MLTLLKQRGKFSGRFYNPAKAGGPILDLDWTNVTVTQAGIDLVKLHTGRFDPSDANAIMIERLEKIVRGNLVATAIDKRFYTHELRELERFRALGVADGVKPDDGVTWNNTHAATLEDYKLKDSAVLLYTPNALEAEEQQREKNVQEIGRGKIMSVVSEIVHNEKPEEVILFFTKPEAGISLPQLDRFYNRAGWAHVGDNMGLLNLVRTMRDDGFVELSGTGVKRGANWREPIFMV